MEQIEIIQGISWLLVLLLVAALAFLAWKNMQLKKELAAGIPARNELDALRQENAAQKQDVANYKQAEQKMQIFVKMVLDLRNGLADAEKKNKPLEQLQSVQQLLKNAKMWPKSMGDEAGSEMIDNIFSNISRSLTRSEQSMDTVRRLQKRIGAFYGSLNVGGAIDNAREQKIRTDLLCLCATIIDAVESIENGNFVEKHQGLNLKVLKEEMTLVAAASKATPVTMLDNETPKWAQTLHFALAKWLSDIDDQPLLLNGYLLNPKN
jgi:hypothetical protein